MRLSDRLSLHTLWTEPGAGGAVVHHGILVRQDEEAQLDHRFNWATRSAQPVDYGLDAVAGWLVDDGPWEVDTGAPPAPPYGLAVCTPQARLAVATLRVMQDELGADPHGMTLAEVASAFGARAAAFASLAPRGG